MSLLGHFLAIFCNLRNIFSEICGLDGTSCSCVFLESCSIPYTDCQGFTCKCQPNYTGKYCDTVISYCSAHSLKHGSDPCQNNSICVDQVDGFKCICLERFTGVFCELYTSACEEKQPCQNDGVCKDSLDGTGYFCDCPLPYIGRTCTEILSACFDNECLKSNTLFCEDLGQAGYRCVCKDGFIGTNCEVYQERYEIERNCILEILKNQS